MTRPTHDGNKNVKISFQPNIGLDASTRQSVVEMLNLLLKDEAVLSLKTQLAGGAHTDEVDKNELQSLYEMQHQQIQTISNQIKERIEILGGSQLNGSETLFDTDCVDENLTGPSNIINILADHEAFIRFLRDETRKCSELFEDQCTYALLINILCAHEKMAWSLRSQISHEAIQGNKL